jgi:hypothetical protein
MPRRLRRVGVRRVVRRRKRGGNQPPGGPAIDMPANPYLNINVPPNVRPDFPKPVYVYPKVKLGPLDKIKAYLKTHRLISRGLNAVGARSLASSAATRGYGRRRKYRRRR